MRQNLFYPTWGSYFYPETIDEHGNGVLVNLFNIRKQDLLDCAEDQAVGLRMIDWIHQPLAADFSYGHFKAVHRYLFQDVYPWAGQERQVSMAKAGHNYYPAGTALTNAAEQQFSKLTQADCLRGLDRESFVNQLAEFWGEINVIHSFREGNTRTQSVFFSQLADAAGHPFSLHKLSQEPLRSEFVQARFYSQDTGSNARLAEVLDKVIYPKGLTPDRPQTRQAVSDYIQQRLGQKINKSTGYARDYRGRNPRL